MNWMDKLERKIGRYAVPNLMLYIIIMYGAGYVLYLINPAFYAQYLCLNAQAILHGQVWRIITFIIQPPSYSLIWMLVASGKNWNGHGGLSVLTSTSLPEFCFM